MDKTIKIVIVVIMLVIFLASCDPNGGKEVDMDKQVAWAADFCGGKSRIADLALYTILQSDVTCVDARHALIPKVYK